MAGQIVTLHEVKAHLQFVNPDTDATPASIDVTLQGLLDAATEWVENYVGPVTEHLYVERHDGWSGERIELLHTPVLRMNYVREYRSTGGLLDLDESTPENAIDGYQIEYPTGRLIRVFLGGWPRTWFPGSRNIEVSYVAGHEPIPAQVRLATLELVAHWYRNTQQAPPPGSAAYGPYDASETAPGLWQAVPYRIIALVDGYRTQAIG